jgi:hypothetical protein
MMRRDDAHVLSSRTRTRVRPSMHLPASPATLLVRTPTSIMDVTPYHLVCYLLRRRIDGACCWEGGFRSVGVLLCLFHYLLYQLQYVRSLYLG